MDRFRNLIAQLNDPHRVAQATRRAVEVGVALCVLLAPMALGGRYEAGKLLYIGLVMGTCAAWLTCRRSSGEPRLPPAVFAVLAAVLAIPLVQIVPLPSGLLDQLSPARATLLPAWEADGGLAGLLGQWRTLSYATSETRLGIALAVAHVGLFLVAFHAIRDKQDVRRLLGLIAGGAVLMAAIGVVQSVLPNGKILWVYDYAYRKTGAAAQGAFTTPNHFGHFVMLGLGPLAYFLLHTLKTGPLATRSRSGQNAGTDQAKFLAAACLAGLVVVLAAAVMSQSRGVLGTLVIALALCGLLFARIGWLRWRQVAVGAITAVVLASIAVSLGYGSLEEGGTRDLNSIEDWQNDNGRFAIWAANARAFVASPWIGYGIGTHRDVYHAFMSTPCETEFTHAESGYLQVATECGLAGIVLLVAVLALLWLWCSAGLRSCSNPEDAALWSAIIVGLATCVLHGAVDFIWYVPACLLVAILLAAAAARLHQLTAAAQAQTSASHDHRSHGYLPAAVSLALVWAVVAAIPAARAAQHWDRYLQANRALDFVSQRQLTEPDERALRKLADERDYYLASMVAELRAVVAIRPDYSRAHERLASRCLQQFELSRLYAENAMTLPSIREAALAAEFPSEEEVRGWLNRAFDQNSRLLLLAHDHARAALRLDPLSAEAYMQLAQLDFLESAANRNTPLLTNQAMRVRPLDGAVLYEAGLQSHFAGDLESWRERWRKAIELPGDHRYRMVSQMACCLPAQVLLDEFPVDWKMQQFAYRTYEQAGDTESLRVLAKHATDSLAQPAGDLSPGELAFRWRQASAMQLSLDQVDAA
ncbi:MAG: O-antigen ligase family protein, partial [Planctomycetales bacterium]|nr:O-antigen ligase family protein [Planctomycetales bacterium]